MSIFYLHLFQIVLSILWDFCFQGTSSHWRSLYDREEFSVRGGGKNAARESPLSPLPHLTGAALLIFNPWICRVRFFSAGGWVGGKVRWSHKTICLLWLLSLKQMFEISFLFDACKSPFFFIKLKDFFWGPRFPKAFTNMWNNMNLGN